LPIVNRGATIQSMREFRIIGILPLAVLLILKKHYRIHDDQISISEETVRKITESHPGFGKMDVAALVNDILINASAIQSNQRDDTVRIIGINGELTNPVSNMSADKLLYLIVRLSNQHSVNFVKSLYPRNKLKGGVFLWQKPKE